MRGEFTGVWAESWSAIWLPLTEAESIPEDVYCDLYRELTEAFAEKPSIEMLADIIDDPAQSRQALIDSVDVRFVSEKALVRFFEAAYDVLDELQIGGLTDRYVSLLQSFIERYSLGYALRAPCSLTPTLPGMFADVASALRAFSETDVHLSALYRAHEEAIKDLRMGATEDRIKTCISKQFMLLEAVASKADNVKAKSLGEMCDQIDSWPHATIRESLKKLYGFASDYPGIRHAGNPEGKARDIEIRDLAALSILLMGYSTYLTATLQTRIAAQIET